jgi:hypothetical protein
MMGRGTLPSPQPQEAFTMRCFTPPAGTRFYAGVDLHARALFLVVLDHDGRVVFARNLPAAPEAFLRAVHVSPVCFFSKEIHYLVAFQIAGHRAKNLFDRAGQSTA